MNLFRHSAILAALAAMGLASASFAGDKKDAAAPDAYPLKTCPVSGKELGSKGEPVSLVQDGREVKLCCAGCEKPFKNDAAAMMKKIDAQIIAEQGATYPLETCVVSGKKLGEMGKPVDQLVGNRLVKLCCGGCVKPLQQDTAKHLAKLDEAVIAKESKDYPLDTCVVSGDKLGGHGDPINKVVGGHLVKLCCKGCIEDAEKNPGKYLKMLDDARKEKAKK